MIDTLGHAFGRNFEGLIIRGGCGLDKSTLHIVNLYAEILDRFAHIEIKLISRRIREYDYGCFLIFQNRTLTFWYINQNRIKYRIIDRIRPHRRIIVEINIDMVFYLGLRRYSIFMFYFEADIAMTFGFIFK